MNVRHKVDSVWLAMIFSLWEIRNPVRYHLIHFQRGQVGFLNPQGALIIFVACLI